MKLVALLLVGAACLAAAEGEFAASQRLTEAAHMLASEPLTMQLRYLQTLTEIGVEKNTTIVFPLPVDIMANIQRILERTAASGPSGNGATNR